MPSEFAEPTSGHKPVRKAVRVAAASIATFQLLSQRCETAATARLRNSAP
jgi:hypothetical protein